MPVTVSMALSACSAVLAQGGPPPALVRVDAVVTEAITEMRVVTGDLRAVRRATVASREAGAVIELPLEVGQRVEEGALLARLDARRLEIMLEQANADLAAAQATIAERQVDLDWRQDDFNLLLETSELSAASPKEMLDTRAAASLAQARLDQAERMLGIIERQIEFLQQRLADTEVRAPFAGVIVSKATEVGEWVGEGDAIAEVLEVDAVEAWINVPQGQYRALAADASGLQVMIDATGAVETPQSVRILPQVDQTARTFTVIARLTNEDGQFAPGMSITAWAPTDVRGDHLTISKNAVLRNDSGDFAYVVRDGVAMPARLRILFPADDRYVIQSAELAAGDLVVVEGNERLFPTAPVSIIED